MKRILVVLLAVFALGASFAQTKFPLQIGCNVMDADVYINGKLYTKTTPNLTVQLPVATYSIKIAKAGYSEFNATVSVSSKGGVLNAILQPLGATPTQTPLPNALLQSFPINITSNVQGASVYLSTKYMGQTPLGVNVLRGDYDLLVQAPGYGDFTQRVQVRGATTINAFLQQTGMQLSISANVPNAAVTINGAPAGKAPFSTTLPPGSYTISVSAPGYTAWTQNVVMNGNQSIMANLQSQNFGLQVTATNAPGALVFINGNQAGTSPLNTALPPGSYSILIRAPGFLDYNGSVNLSSPQVLSATLQPMNFGLQITATNAPGAQIFLNGNQVGTSPFNSSLPPGNYSILIRAPGFSDYNSSVNLSSAQVISATLQPALVSYTFNVPANFLNNEAKGNPHTLIQLYFDNVLVQPGANGAWTGALSPGVHQVRILAGGLKLEGNVDVQAGRPLVLEPTFGIITR